MLYEPEGGLKVGSQVVKVHNLPILVTLKQFNTWKWIDKYMYV